jgi:hypothetical protein
MDKSHFLEKGAFVFLGFKKRSTHSTWKQSSNLFALNR